MKKINFILLFFLTFTVNLLQAQETQENEKLLLGCISFDDFQQQPYAKWFNDNYKNYQVDTNTLQNINKDSLMDCSVTIVFGSWCPDSRAEVPGFLKVCDFLGIDRDNIKLIGVDRTKDVIGDCVQGETVKYVPTYFFYYKGNLLNKTDDHSGISFEQLFNNFY